jgi:acetolactate synthase I/II/III large subunit
MIKLSDYIVSFLENKGVKDIFMLSGGFCLPLVDSVGKSGINHVCTLHEQAAAIAAEAYAQYNKSPGVCLVTAGPGGTNTITGVASAWLDSIPVIVLSGQVQKKDVRGQRKVRQIGFQEIDMPSIVRPITKYSKTIMDPRDVKKVMEKAWHLATSGRQGPVWIEVPLDVQSAMVDPDALEGYGAQKPNSCNDELRELVAKFYKLLEDSERPVILAGNGIRSSNAESKFLDLAGLLGIPVMTTWKAIDYMDEEDPLFVGRPGIAAQRGANFSQQTSDLFISIGARLDHGQTAFNHKNFARNAKKVIIDIDRAEIDKMEFQVDCPIVFDAGAFIDEAIAQYQQPRDFSGWLARCKGWQKKYPVVVPDYWEQKELVNNYVLIDVLSDLMQSSDLLIPGSSGASSEVTMQAFRTKKGMRIFNSEGLGSMGFGIPSAIGGCIASNLRHTICVDGDGGFVMNIQELETVRRLQLPIKFFILNNSGYVSIRNSQNKHFDQELASSEDSGVTLPDFEKIAKSYGLNYCKINSQEQIHKEVQSVLDAAGPVVCEIMMLDTHETLPRNSTHKREDGTFVSLPMEDLLPLLPRSEFEENMSVSNG